MRARTGSTVIGLCGGSGSGKTTLAREVTSLLGRNRATSISFDSYYHDLAHLTTEQRAAVNYDAPDSLDVGLLTDHLDALLALANRHVEPAISIKEVRAYYADDARMWAFLQWLRRIDRRWHRLTRRTYPFLLPGKIERHV